MKSALLAGAISVAALSIVAGLGAWFSYAGPGPAKAKTTVVLQKGVGVSGVASALKTAHVIGSPTLFKIAAKLTGADRKLKAGEYEFESHASMASVIRKIAAGLRVRHLVTIPEGKTSAQVAAILKANPVLTGEVAVPPEGSILPETYEATRGEARADLVKQMRSARDAVLADLWAHRAPGLPLKTPEEAVTLASLVEKETALPAERPHVAAVFENRLRKGIPLASDPTVIYAVSKGEPLGRGIRESELRAKNPYNTYLVAGLPPTPIANPGRAAIAAVLNPAKSDDLYFVADGTGGHVFSATYEQHQKNVVRWRQIEQGRGAAPARSLHR